MRSIADPFVVRLPAGARVRTRLRLTTADEAVLRVVGAHLGRLAGHDLAWRCRLGRSDNQRTLRKRAATSQSSSRWAGTITRTSNEQRQRGLTNLVNYRIGLRRAVDSIRTRLAVPVGGKQGRVNGYATQAERYAKQRRLQHLEAELATVEDRLSSARVSVCRGGHRLAKLRHRLDHVDVELTEADWQARWQAKRWFLTADGDATKHWGNETIRVHPEQQWMELRLPTPMADLSNTPGRACTYRLACPVTFHHRRDEWAVQAATGPVRYDISYEPSRNRWYLDASWQTEAVQPPPLDELRRSQALGVDLNAEHLACWVLDSSGNRLDSPTPFLSTWTPCRPAPEMVGYGRRSLRCFGWQGRMDVAPSWSKIWISPTLARPAGRPLDVGAAPDGSARPSRECPPVASERSWPEY
jgi:hypothetical protein